MFTFVLSIINKIGVQIILLKGIAMINPTETFASVLRAAAAVEESIRDGLPSNPSNPDLILGENGCPEYTAHAVGDARVAMFSKFVRGTPTDKIDELVSLGIEQIDAQTSETDKISYIRDLFVLMFEKRDCRGGEGEKAIPYHLFWRLVVEYPAYSSAMIGLFAEYGYWGDIFNVINYIRIYNKLADAQSNSNKVDISELDVDSDSDSEPGSVLNTAFVAERSNAFVKTLDISIETIKEFTDKMIEVIKSQLDKDIELMGESKPISLLAKWLPTEGGGFAKHNHVVFKRLLKALGLNERSYRVQIVAMRNHIDVAETHMCNGTWSEIDPKKLPSKCAFINRNGFLNLLTKTQAEKLGRLPYLLDNEQETGNRYPEREDRVLARAKMLEAISKGKVKGAQLSPDMLVIAMIDAITENEKAMLNAQWVSLRDSVQAKIEKARSDGFDPMDNIVPMVDLSPSMKGTPMMAAIGLGIMLSELNSGACRDLLITFDSDCHIVDLSGLSTFSEKVARIRSLPVGYTTNFQLAMQRICDLIERHRLPENSVPALCILSDEQFDHPQFGYDVTMEGRMVKMFHNVGMRVSGTPYSKPRTVHWNLRGDTEGFPAKADDRNVQMVAGYSPALFDLILCGKPEPTPFETMRRKLDSPRYQPVRDAFDSV